MGRHHLNRWRRVGLAALSAVAAASLGGCQTRIDTERLEAALTDEIERQSGARPEGVDCPDEVIEAPGESFGCALTLNGEARVVKATMKGEGEVDWTLLEPGATLTIGVEDEAPVDGGDEGDGAAPPRVAPADEAPARGDGAARAADGVAGGGSEDDEPPAEDS